MVEEGRAEEEGQRLKGTRHTFDSSSRPSASHPLAILGRWVIKIKPARNVSSVEHLVLRAIHLSIGHLLYLRFFVLKAASFLNASYSCVSNACNPGACDQQSTSILG
jgi:hypothetical protein